jgi:hypothetical protein
MGISEFIRRLVISMFKIQLACANNSINLQLQLSTQQTFIDLNHTTCFDPYRVIFRCSYIHIRHILLVIFMQQDANNKNTECGNYCMCSCKCSGRLKTGTAHKPL